MSILKKNFWTSAKEWSMVTLGALIYVTSWALFLIPNNLVGGGVSGISSIIQYATGGTIQMGYSYFTINVILLVIAFFVIGTGFGAKTIYAIILASVGLRFLPGLIPPEIINSLAIQNGKLISEYATGQELYFPEAKELSWSRFTPEKIEALRKIEQENTRELEEKEKQFEREFNWQK